MNYQVSGLNCTCIHIFFRKDMKLSITLYLSDLRRKYYGVAYVSVALNSFIRIRHQLKKTIVVRYIVEPDHQVGYKLPFALVIYSAIVTYAYLIINDPVFHQISYAILVITVVYRSVVLYNKIPATKTYERPRVSALLWMSAFGFIISFILWNIDNQFCTSLRAWRHTVSFPVGTVSEVMRLYIDHELFTCR